MSNEVIFYGEHTEAAIFEYLNALKDEGTVNMLGAPRELERVYGLTRRIARQAFRRWSNLEWFGSW